MAIHTDKVESNWAGNVRYSSNAVCYPQSISELQQLLQNLDEAKAIGTCHSFSTIADTQGFQISAGRLQHAIKLDAAASQVTVGAAVRYGELAEFLDTRGYALPAMASLPHISVVGGCATATHGSGNTLGNLSTSVESLEIVTGSGELRTLTRAQHGDLFNGVVVHLGALGFVTSITLRVIPRFLVAQTVYSNLDCQELCAHFETITGSAYSVSLFTDWRGSNINQVWVKERVDNAAPLPSHDDFYGAARAISPMHPISYLSPDSCTTQLGIPGPWHERLPHFKSSHNPSVGDEIQSEYFVSIELAT
jgi:xylitol oxidase